VATTLAETELAAKVSDSGGGLAGGSGSEGDGGDAMLGEGGGFTEVGIVDAYNAVTGVTP